MTLGTFRLEFMSIRQKEEWRDSMGDMTKIYCGKCEICEKPVMVAQWVLDALKQPVTTCCRKCGELKHKGGLTWLDS
jgi:hypothetical protein